jgi:hypothetical protein
VLVAAAVCPHPPLLIPHALGAAGAADSAGPANAAHPLGAADPLEPADALGPGEDADAADGAGRLARTGPAGTAILRQVRAACFAAVADLAAARPDLIAVVGGGPVAAGYGGSAAGSLREFGIPYVTGAGQPVLPLSLTVGAWLIRTALPATGRPELRLNAVARDTPPAVCLRLGAQLAQDADRVALLIMGDASARRASGVSGAPDSAADSYDREVATALAAGDPGRLARLDPALDDELAIAGRAAWQVLAGAARGCRIRGTLRCTAAPYDVSYLVASWECSPGRALTH